MLAGLALLLLRMRRRVLLHLLLLLLLMLLLLLLLGVVLVLVRLLRPPPQVYGHLLCSGTAAHAWSRTLTAARHSSTTHVCAPAWA